MFDYGIAKRPRLTMPWEQGFAGLILSSPAQPVFRVPTATLDPKWDAGFLRDASKLEIPRVVLTGICPDASGSAATIRLEPTASSSGPGVLPPAFLQVGRKKEQIAWTVKDQKDRAVAMARWKMLIEQNPSGSRLGRELAEMKSKGDHQDLIEKTVSDTFEKKASTTILMRSGSLLLYERWLRARPGSPVWIPFVEPLAYSYLSDIRDSKKPASR
jgi:hypothetical protein